MYDYIRTDHNKPLDPTRVLDSLPAANAAASRSNSVKPRTPSEHPDSKNRTNSCSMTLGRRWRRSAWAGGARTANEALRRGFSIVSSAELASSFLPAHPSCCAWTLSRHRPCTCTRMCFSSSSGSSCCGFLGCVPSAPGFLSRVFRSEF